MFILGVGEYLMSKSRHIKGFTLIEFAIVIAISGIMLSAAMELYSIYLKGKVQSATYETMDKFNGAINAFYSTQKRYPCPSDPALPESSPLAGIENCILATPVGSCSGGICKTEGRDADGNSVPDQILIGAIPYRTLKIARDDLKPYDGVIQDDIAICNKAVIAGSPLALPCSSSLMPSQASMADINSRDTFDSWGNRLTYAVSSRLTSNATGNFDVSFGAISVRTESGVELTNPPGSVLWIIVSHGDDGVGSYSSYGKKARACAGSSRDIENCDNDDIFINGIRIMVPGSTYFDDLTYYSVSRLSSLWTSAQTNSTAGSDETKDIANLNIGNVGIGVSTPSERLDVAGVIKAQNAISTQICDTAGLNCFNAGTFGAASGVYCPAASGPGKIQVMTAIKNGGVVCEEVNIVTAVSPSQCPIGQSMIGIDIFGNLVCVVP